MKEKMALELADPQPGKTRSKSTAAKYNVFLNKKSQAAGNDGFKSLWMPSFLFDFQAHLTDWSLWKGRGALQDCQPAVT